MLPRESVLGSIPGRQSSGPKERYPGYGSLHYTQYGILLFLLQRGPCVLVAVVFGDLGEVTKSGPVTIGLRISGSEN